MLIFPQAMKRLRSNKHALHVLKDASPKLRKAILQSGDDELIKTIIECVINTLNGNHKISGELKQKLCKYKNCFRKLVHAKTSLKKKRKIIIQKGGFLIPLLGSILSGVIGSLINRK